MPILQNGISSMQNIFKICNFRIPQYQRAYSWEEEHLEAFLNDLQQHSFAQKGNPDKNYFLGTLLLHEKDEKTIHVVDGQQRLTTSVIFIAAALDIINKKLISVNNNIKTIYRDFIYDNDEEIQKFHTIEEDNPFLRSFVLKINETNCIADTPSAKRIQFAFEYFQKKVIDNEWEYLLKILTNANLMIYAVTNSSDATLIFELQNDRGKKLTSLEALKSYLMHLIYINSKNPEESLSEIQVNFASIYRDIEKQSQNKKIPLEDSILSYHCVAFLNWKKDEWREPKALIKEFIKNFDTKELSVTDWIIKFVTDLKNTYQLITKLFDNLIKYTELADLILLDRVATFWPLIIKTYLLDDDGDKKNFKISCRLMEVYAMRAYGISNMRSDTGMPTIYAKARDFNSGTDFDSLKDHLYSMSNWYGLENRCLSSIDHPYLYRIDRKDTLYLLWKYENYLREQKGQQAARLSYSDYIAPETEATKLSIEHIAAIESKISDTVVEWKKGEKKKFIEVATHRLGNLVIDFLSPNASKGKKEYDDKLEHYISNSTFLSQAELKEWAVVRGGKRIWNVESVKKRHEYLTEWALGYWDPKKHYTPKTIIIVEEEEDITNSVTNE